MHNSINIEQLMQKPVAMMTGEELTHLIGSITQQNHAEQSAKAPTRQLYYGIAGIAEIFGCSVPTANRIKKSGIIDGAITQVGRKIVVDGQKALSLAHGVDWKVALKRSEAV